MKTKLIACMTAVMMLTGCASLGPRIAKVAQRPYNEALVYSWKEQLLLNLVRLRYRDDPYFIEVTSVVSNHTIDLGASLELTFPHMSRPGSQKFTPQINYNENPTITYQPLQGAKYVKRLLGHIPMKTVLGLANSGWSIERVLKICVQEVNGIPNAIDAACPTPEFLPEYEAFHRLASNLRKLQIANLIKIDTDPNYSKIAFESLVEPGDKDLYFKIICNGTHTSTIHEVQQALGLDEACKMYKFSSNLLAADNPEIIKLKTRTFLGTLYYLSQAVEVPQQHIDCGLVTVTRDPEGNPINWCDIIGDAMTIRSQYSEPDCAAVKVCYRGHWFYIADNDLNSKSSFMLLSKLFNIQDEPSGSNVPQLTIPINHSHHAH